MNNADSDTNPDINANTNAQPISTSTSVSTSTTPEFDVKGKELALKGAIISAEQGQQKAIIDLLDKLLDTHCFDAVLIPVKVPAGDSFTYLLVQDRSILKDKGALPLPPIMSVQGGKALSSITRTKQADSNIKIAAIMRPCEISAAIELAKLEQVDLTNLTLISMDCPGVLPMSDYIADPQKGMDTFNTAMAEMNDDPMRPICQICDKFGLALGDLHIGTLGAEKGQIFVIPTSSTGNDIISALGLVADKSVNDWQVKVNEVTQTKQSKRDQVYQDLNSMVMGIDNLLDIFSQCINCHNCLRVCPICYCQQCYFDSENFKYPPDDYLSRAEKAGSIRFPPDTLLYHVGRMMHMSYSCVACGCCEDACPVSIPVGQIYSMIGQKTQEIFDYVPGKEINVPRPLTTYIKEELQEVED